MTWIRELARSHGLRAGDDEAEEVAESRGGVEPCDVVLGADFLGRGDELMGESEEFHLLRLGDRGPHDDFFGVGGGCGKVDGGQADGDVGRGG